MQPAEIKYREVPVAVYYVVCGLLVSLYLLAPYLNLEVPAGNIFLLLLVAGGLVLLLRYKQLLLLSLCFFVPVSVQLPVAGNTRLSFPAELIAAGISVFFVVKIISGCRVRKELLTHPLTLFVCADVCWLMITSFSSGMPEVSFKRLAVRIVYYITFYYFFYELLKQDKSNIRRVIYLYLCGLLVPVVYTIWRHAEIRFAMVGSQQISAPFYFDHTIYGAALVFFIPFLSGEIFFNRRNHTWLKVILLVVILLATVLSYSRAAWLSLIISMAFYFWVHFKIRAKTILFLACVAVVIVLFNINKVNASFSDNKQVSHTNDVGMHLKSVSNISTDASNKERINRWKCALRMFADKPLLGFGPGTYQFFYGPYQLRGELTRISTFTGNKGHAHSEYLNYLSETGLPGMIIFILLLFTALIRGFKLARYPNQFSSLALAFSCGLLGFAIHAFFNGFLEFEKIAMPVFFSIAAIVFMDIEDRKPIA